jgi:hypothetical protein
MAQVEGAFAKVQDAERAGANVSNLDASLNQAVHLIGMGNAVQQTNSTEAQELFSQAETIANQVAASAQAEIPGGNASTSQAEEALYSSLGGIAITCVLVYLYLPRIFWGIWLRMNSRHRVERID